MALVWEQLSWRYRNSYYRDSRSSSHATFRLQNSRLTSIQLAAVTKNYAQIKDRCVAKPSDQQNAVEALDDLFIFLFRIDLSLKMSVEKVGSAYLFVMTLFVLCTVCIDV